MRFDTGSTSEAVFASTTVTKANGSGSILRATAIATTTGVSSTAVVSRERKAVATVASSTTRAQSSAVRPRAIRARRAATTSNRPAFDANSATIVTATTNSRMGQTRSATARASSAGKAPVSSATIPRIHSTPPMMARVTAPLWGTHRAVEATTAR